MQQFQGGSKALSPNVDKQLHPATQSPPPHPDAVALVICIAGCSAPQCNLPLLRSREGHTHLQHTAGPGSWPECAQGCAAAHTSLILGELDRAKVRIWRTSIQARPGAPSPYRELNQPPTRLNLYAQVFAWARAKCGLARGAAGLPASSAAMRRLLAAVALAAVFLLVSAGAAQAAGPNVLQTLP